MEEILEKIIENNELRLFKHKCEIKERNHKINFLREHKFDKEADHLFVKKQASNDLYLDYKSLVENLRKVLNDWNT